MVLPQLNIPCFVDSYTLLSGDGGGGLCKREVGEGTGEEGGETGWV